MPQWTSLNTFCEVPLLCRLQGILVLRLWLLPAFFFLFLCPVTTHGRCDLVLGNLPTSQSHAHKPKKKGKKKRVVSISQAVFSNWQITTNGNTCPQVWGFKCVCAHFICHFLHVFVCVCAGSCHSWIMC